MRLTALRSSSMRIFTLLFAATILFAGCGGGGGGSTLPPNNTMSQPLATAMLKGAPGFINAAGFTVYVFDADLASPGTSVCNGTCAAVWPPVPPPTTSMPVPWSAITRSDHSMQLAFNGRPLYLYSLDTGPGTTNGDGVVAFGGAWHIARPLSGASPGPSPSVGPSPTVMPSGY